MEATNEEQLPVQPRAAFDTLSKSLQPSDLPGLVRCCRLAKTYQGEVKKVHMHIADFGARRVIVQVMKHMGADHRIGKYPKTAIEAAAQRLLEKNGKEGSADEM